MSLGVTVGLCSDGPVSHLRMSLPRRRAVIATAVALKRHEGVNAFNLVVIGFIITNGWSALELSVR